MEGLLASVDGLRFVVSVKCINTGPSPKYYGYKRGMTWLNALNDQVAGIAAMVVRGSPLPPKDRHVNFLGRYLFNIKAGGSGQGLRPFRDPEAVEDDED